MTIKSLNIVFLVQILIFSVSMIILSYRIFLPYSHVVLSGLLVFLCAMSVMFAEKDSKIPLVSILVAGVFFRSIYALAMGPNVIPLSDSYADYAWTAFSLSDCRVDIYTGQGGILNLEAISQWPLLHTFTAELVQITGLDLTLTVSCIVPMIIGLISTTVVYLFFMCVLTNLGLGNRVALMATLLYVLLPHQMYETIQFIRGSFGLIWIYFLLYIIARNFFRERSLEPFLLITFAVSLVISHHYSSFLFLLFILVAWVCNNLLSVSLSRRTTRIDSKKKPFRSIVRVLPIILLSWWLYYATLAFIFGRNLLFIFYPIERGYIRQLERSSSLLELRPVNILSIVMLRDIIVYGFIAAGILYFIFIFIKKFVLKDVEKEYVFITSSLVAVCSTFILAALLIGSPDKSIAFFAPILLLFSGLCFHKLNINRLPLKVLLLLAITVAGIGVALAPFSHNYAPIYLYDNSVRPEETNTHNPNYWRVSPFLNSHFMNSSYVSDDGRLLYAILPIKGFQFVSSFGLGSDYEDFDDGTIIVRFGNYPSDRGFWTIASLNADKIYSSGLPEIWIKR